MKKIICIFLLATLFFASGCPQHPSVQSSSILKICANYAVPEITDDDLKGLELSTIVLDKDSYGRILFSCSYISVFTEQENSATVICQGYSNEYVSYYEDFCYVLGKTAQEEIDALKADNDWDKPINTEKICYKKYKITADMVAISPSELEYPKIKTAVCTALGVQKAEIVEVVFLDFDGNGKEMYYITTATADGEKRYLAILDSEYDVSFLEISMNNISRESIHEFKNDSTWLFNTGIR